MVMSHGWAAMSHHDVGDYKTLVSLMRKGGRNVTPRARSFLIMAACLKTKLDRPSPPSIMLGDRLSLIGGR